MVKLVLLYICHFALNHSFQELINDVIWGLNCLRAPIILTNTCYCSYFFVVAILVSVFHRHFDLYEVLKKCEQGAPHWPFTLGPVNDVAGTNWRKITIKEVPAPRSHSPSLFSPETQKAEARKEEEEFTCFWHIHQILGRTVRFTLRRHLLGFQFTHSPKPLTFLPYPSLPLSYPLSLNSFKWDSPTVYYMPARYWARCWGSLASSFKSLDSQSW